ncbi:hypothetical protein HK100_010596, partial [Physocladia obscura]
MSNNANINTEIKHLKAEFEMIRVSLREKLDLQLPQLISSFIFKYLAKRQLLLSQTDRDIDEAEEI